MKKSKALIIVLACVLILIVALFTVYGQRPFKGLDAREITSATVHLNPPDKTVRIVEIKELVEYLKDIVIYNKDNSYTEYYGQGVIFTLIMADGTQTEVMAYNPFVVIDGVGYKTKYEPCAALASYANDLLNREDARIIWEKPPALAVVCGDTSLGALMGTASWMYKNEDGTFSGINADSMHPLDSNSKEYLLLLETTEPIAALRFQENPDSISVHCWDAKHWGDTFAESEPIAAKGNEISLKQGAYIYEVIATWDSNEDYGGTVYYSFYIDTSGSNN